MSKETIYDPPLNPYWMFSNEQPHLDMRDRKRFFVRWRTGYNEGDWKLTEDMYRYKDGPYGYMERVNDIKRHNDRAQIQVLDLGADLGTFVIQNEYWRRDRD